jgi:hypothetical protein
MLALWTFVIVNKLSVNSGPSLGNSIHSDILRVVNVLKRKIDNVK